MHRREYPTVKLSITHAAPRADRMETINITIDTIFSPLNESGADKAVIAAAGSRLPR